MRDTIKFGDLRLDEAAALLRQSGHDLGGEEDPAAVTDRLQRMIDALCELSARDALTGLANVRQFHSILDREIDRVARIGAPMVLLLIDADRFKLVNDTYGHQAGDQVLRSLALRLGDGLRPMDTPARYGGEEFAVILPNCSPAHGHKVAERIRQQVAATPIDLPDGRPIGVTVSIGGPPLRLGSGRGRTNSFLPPTGSFIAPRAAAEIALPWESRRNPVSVAKNAKHSCSQIPRFQ